MTDNDDPLFELWTRLSQVSPSDSEEETLAKTGMDAWQAPSSPLNTTEHHAFVDPATDESAESLSFQASFTRPTDFPAEWPFVPDHDCHLLRFQAGSEESRMMLWMEPDDPTAVVQAVRDNSAELGWHEHSSDSDPTPSKPLVWLHRDDKWRALRLTTEPTLAVSLMERKPERMWRERETESGT
jgi:hypothetical protein